MKEKLPKRTLRRYVAIVIFPGYLLELFFFRRFLFSLKRKSGKEKR
jgi:hypothetical protein